MKCCESQYAILLEIVTTDPINCLLHRRSAAAFKPRTLISDCPLSECGVFRDRGGSSSQLFKSFSWVASFICLANRFKREPNPFEHSQDEEPNSNSRSGSYENYAASAVLHADSSCRRMHRHSIFRVKGSTAKLLSSHHAPRRCCKTLGKILFDMRLAFIPRLAAFI